MTARPLLTAADSARALEATAASARAELLLCLPYLDPRTPLTRTDLRKRGLGNWGDLIAWITRRGVALRMLAADVDPLARPGTHRAVWARSSGFADVVQGDAQVLCAPHGQSAGGLRGWRLRGAVQAALTGLRAEPPERLTPVQRRALSAPPPPRIAEIGQAFVLADGQSCVLGAAPLGMATEGDVPAALFVDDSDFCAALRGHFADSWTQALAAGSQSLATPATPFEMPRRTQSRADLRLIRTLSRPRRGFAPKQLVADHERTLTMLFETAGRYVLIRTEALRHDALAESLARAARRVTELNLILMLPARAARDPWDDARARRKQTSALGRLKAAFGPRMALCADPAPGGTLCLVDDEAALIGSAALTRRACRWNTEASALVRDPALVVKLMDDLGRLHPERPSEAEALRRAATWSAALPAPDLS